MELSLSSTGAADECRGPHEPVIVRNLTKRNKAEEFTTQLLHGFSGEPIFEPHNTSLPNAVFEPGVSFQDPQEVRLIACEQEALSMLALGKFILRCVNTGGKR